MQITAKYRHVLFVADNACFQWRVRHETILKQTTYSFPSISSISLSKRDNSWAIVSSFSASILLCVYTNNNIGYILVAKMDFLDITDWRTNALVPCDGPYTNSTLLIGLERRCSSPALCHTWTIPVPHFPLTHSHQQSDNHTRSR